MKRSFSKKNLWERVPFVVRACVGSVARFVPPDRILGKAFRRHLSFVREAQSWSSERARDYQVAELRRVLELAYHKTSFYRRAFDEVGFKPEDFKGVDDIRRLPFIDKDTLRGQLTNMCARSTAGSDVDYTATGGSSGTPLQFYIGSNRSAIEFAYLVSGWERVGFKLGTPLAVFRGQLLRPGERHEYDPILRRHYYNNFAMTPDNLAYYIEHVRNIGPCFLHVYPSSALVLARYVKGAGIEAPKNIRGILSGSEMVAQEHRTEVEAVFGCRYYSWYGHSEKLVMGAACETTEDYHLFPTYGCPELVDEDGQPVTTPGARGEIVGTGFINDVIPFVRYKTGDFAEYVGEKCDACGREHMIIRNVLGRWPQGALQARDGTPISMTSLNLHNDAFKNVRQYQFFQDKLGEAVLRIVPLVEVTEDDARAIESSLSARLDGRVTLSVEIVSSLPVTKAGKFVLVDQRLDSQS